MKFLKAYFENQRKELESNVHARLDFHHPSKSGVQVNFPNSIWLSSLQTHVNHDFSSHQMGLLHWEYFLFVLKQYSFSVFCFSYSLSQILVVYKDEREVEFNNYQLLGNKGFRAILNNNFMAFD